MADDRIEGSAKEMKGSVKKGAGEMLGDRELREEGRANKAEGQIQGAWGRVKDAFRQIMRR